MKCEELLKHLNDYVDEDIDPEICERFEEHIQDCDPCKIVIDNTKKTVTLYRDEEIYEMPEDFKKNLHRELKEKWDDTHGG